MRALNRKLLREVWHLKGQFFSIALVVATGIMSVLVMRGSYDSLVDAQQGYYRQTRFAQVWAPVKRAPESLRARLEAIPGVATVDTRISFLSTLDLPGLDMPAQGLFVSLPEHTRPVLNDIELSAGRYFEPGPADEVLISENFSKARKLEPGGSLRAIINGRLRELDVVGVATSPEHTYSVPPGSLYPDDERYGVMWMSREVLGPAYDMDGAFNEALFTLGPNANVDAVTARIDQVLDPYGGLGAYERSEQLSHQILQSELNQNRIMGTAFPVVFLGVAAFLLNLVLGRLITTQRSEIAVLKAFGYSNREVGQHYLMFSLMPVLLGALLGAAVGVWLGQGYIAMYGQYFNFPDLAYRLSASLLTIATLVSVAAAAAGALLAVRRAASLPPAEAMRAEPPARFKASWMEQLGLSRWLSSSGRMIVRNLERKPIQTLLSAVGVALSTAILLMGISMLDGVNYMMDLQFKVIQREDLALSFDNALDASVVRDLQHIAGVTHVEPMRTVPVRLHAGHRQEAVSLQGLDPDGRLRRIIAQTGKVYPLPLQGAVISRILANRLQLKPGDVVRVDVLEGRRRQGSIVIAGVVDDFLGLSASMNLDALQKLVEGPAMLTGAFLSIDEDRRNTVNRYLKTVPGIAGVSSPQSMLESFQKQMDESLYIVIVLLIGFASVIAVGVIYNGARISLSERGRELASLRVMGFRRNEATTLLLGEQAVITLMAIPIGWLLGYFLAYTITESIQSDTYRLPFIVSTTSYAVSALITLLAAIFSGVLVRRRVDRLDLIEVLKTRE